MPTAKAKKPIEALVEKAIRASKRSGTWDAVKRMADTRLKEKKLSTEDYDHAVFEWRFVVVASSVFASSRPKFAQRAAANAIQEARTRVRDLCDAESGTARVGPFVCR